LIFFDLVDESEYGIDEDDIILAEDDSARVIVPQGRLDVSAAHLSELEETFNPLAESTNHGIEIYQEVVLFLENLNYVENSDS
jgi:hypothetical protein